MYQRYHRDLLDQAGELANPGGGFLQGRPKQANLRRAVSAAYYAIFHYMVEEACKAQMGRGNDTRQHRRILGRAFGHANMKEACKPFAGGTLPAPLWKGLESPYVTHQIRDLALTFILLQEGRHQADYDLTEPYRRYYALNLIRQTEAAIDDFDEVIPTASAERNFFLACLWAWPEMKQRVKSNKGEKSPRAP